MTAQHHFIDKSDLAEYSLYFLIPRINTPETTKASPIHSRTNGRSPRNITAKIATNTMLSLSTGATLEASPIFKARK